MSARRYTQNQIAEIFAKAEASANKDASPEFWDAYVLGYVSAALGVRIAKHEADRAAVLR